MRVIIGMVLGVALALGAARLHDNNLPAVPVTLADRPIVNWEVLGAVIDRNTRFVRRLWRGEPA